MCKYKCCVLLCSVLVGLVQCNLKLLCFGVCVCVCVCCSCVVCCVCVLYFVCMFVSSFVLHVFGLPVLLVMFVLCVCCSVCLCFCHAWFCFVSFWLALRCLFRVCCLKELIAAFWRSWEPFGNLWRTYSEPVKNLLIY